MGRVSGSHSTNVIQRLSVPDILFVFVVECPNNFQIPPDLIGGCTMLRGMIVGFAYGNV